MINALLYSSHCCSYDTLIVALLSKGTPVLSRTTIHILMMMMRVMMMMMMMMTMWI
jgi:hypothetical protein